MVKIDSSYLDVEDAAHTQGLGCNNKEDESLEVVRWIIERSFI